MKQSQMSERCQGSKFLRRVYLENAKFIYDGKSIAWDNEAVANIISSEGDVVWGGLFEINDDHLRILDTRYEGFPKSYGRGMVGVKDDEGNIYEAWAYFRVGQKRGNPSSGYRDTILKGASASDCNLPKNYITDSLE